LESDAQIDAEEEFLQQQEADLVYSVLGRRLKLRFGKEKTKALIDSGRFDVRNGDNELKASVLSKKYRDLAALRDYYDLLGISRDAPEEQVEAAYAARASDPRAKYAYETLIDPDKRALYDMKLDELKELFVKQVNSPAFRAVPLGGGREVGRSSFFVKVGTHYVLLDAGGMIVQGQSEPLYPRLDVLESLPRIDAVFVSHVHVDHVLSLPFTPSDAPIYMSPKSLEALTFLSEGFVHQESWTKEEREAVLKRCVPQDSGAIGDLEFKFVNAGHVPGSSMIFLKSGEDSVLYTGDINFEDTQFETAAKPVPEKVKALFIEGTYAGQGKRGGRQERETLLIDTVAKAVMSGKKVLIPAFAVGRTAEVVAILDEALATGEIPQVGAFTVGQGAGLMAKLKLIDLKRFQIVGGAPPEGAGGRPRGVDMVKITYDFKKMMDSDGSVIVVGGSGFADNGIAGQLVSSVVDNPGVLILLTGYQAPGTTGRMLLDAKAGKPIMLPGTNGGPLEVRCDVLQVGLSAHASEEMLLGFINKQNPDTVVLMHIDPEQVDRFSELLHRKNVAPANLQVAFDYAHRGIRLMPYNDEKSAVNSICSCGMKFSSMPTAMRHAELEGHRLVMDAKWYYFNYRSNGSPAPKDIKGSFFAHLKNASAVSDVYVNGDKLVAEGKLTDDEIKQLVASMTHAGRAPISLTYVKAVDIPVAKLNYPLLVAGITTGISNLLKVQLDTPAYRVRNLPPGIAGAYVPSRKLLLINRYTTDQEDLNLVATHEIAHYGQDSVNGKLAEVPTSPEAMTARNLFMEGFAQYVTEKLGCSRKMLSSLHEKADHIPAYYVEGRRMFEDIDAMFGPEKAVDVGLRSSPSEFAEMYSKIGLSAMKSSPLMLRVLAAMTDKKVWKKSLISSGIPKTVREEMMSYMKQNASTVMAEYAGWPVGKVAKDIAMLCFADCLNAKYGLGIPRDDLKTALRFLTAGYNDLGAEAAVAAVKAACATS
jgi:Cft2 family RNA processing exonuclease